MEPFLGQIMLFGGSYAPDGWAICNGSLLPIAGNEALYSILGVIYGGDGVNTFALPNFLSRTAVGAGQAPGRANYAAGAKGGAEMVTVTSANMPAHTHSVQAATSDSNTNNPTGAVLAKVQANHIFYFNPPASPPTGMTVNKVPLSSAAVSTVGSNLTYGMHMPSLGLLYLICTSGIYPSKP